MDNSIKEIKLEFIKKWFGSYCQYLYGFDIFSRYCKTDEEISKTYDFIKYCIDNTPNKDMVTFNENKKPETNAELYACALYDATVRRSFDNDYFKTILKSTDDKFKQEAFFEMGTCYVQRSDEQYRILGIEYFEKAIEMGSYGAAGNLADHYSQNPKFRNKYGGDYKIGKDSLKAAKLYEKAIILGQQNGYVDDKEKQDLYNMMSDCYREVGNLVGLVLATNRYNEEKLPEVFDEYLNNVSPQDLPMQPNELDEIVNIAKKLGKSIDPFEERYINLYEIII